MAWCPKCKAEYVDGIEICADCKVKLVASLDEIENASEEASDQFPEEAVEESAEQNEDISSKENEETTPSERKPVGAYVGSAERANDNRSSAYTLLIIGIIGLVLMVLVATGVVPFWSGKSALYLTCGVMGALFVIFIVMGVVSFRNSKKYARKAAFEEELSANMKKWCLQNLSADALDSALSEEERAMPPEMLFFQRTKVLRAKILEQYMNLDEGFLEHFIEEIYSEIYEA